MHPLGFGKTFVLARSHKYIELISSSELLQPADEFQHDEIHPVLVLSEDSLGFDCNLHINPVVYVL